jgi:hypothetical protein
VHNPKIKLSMGYSPHAGAANDWTESTVAIAGWKRKKPELFSPGFRGDN